MNAEIREFITKYYIGIKHISIYTNTYFDSLLIIYPIILETNIVFLIFVSCFVFNYDIYDICTQRLAFQGFMKSLMHINDSKIGITRLKI